ncbi:MAG TPA: protein kinase, partial [Polyangiaceae bacterium]
MSTPSNRTDGTATKAEGPRGTPANAERAGAGGMGSAGSAGSAERGSAGGEKPGGERSERPSLRPGGAGSLVGKILSGRYFIERLIGEGGMGAVYQAEHTHMRKRLAVKVLHPEMSRLTEVVARFEREAMAAAHIEHPNVAAATDFGKLDDGSFFLVLEYVEGRSLREVLNDSRLDLGRALHVTR